MNESGLPQLGKILAGLGLLLLLAGALLMMGDKLPFLKHLGRLPGDIAIERDNVRVYFPIATSILVSLVLSLLFWLFSGRFK